MTNVNTHPFIRLFAYARNHRLTIIFASASSILNRMFDLAPPILIGAAVDVVVKKQESFIAQFGYPDVKDQLLVLTAITVIIWGLESLFQYVYQVLWRNLAQTIQHELRIDTYNHVQSMELSFFEDESTGGLMSILNNDINQLERFLNGGMGDILRMMTSIVVIGAIFFYTAPSVAWMAILPMPFIIWGSINFQKRLAPRYARVRERVGLLNSQLSNNLGGISTIKSFTAEGHETERITESSEDYREENRSAIALSSAFTPLIRLVIMIGFIAILVFGGNLALEGSLDVGAYSVLIFITQRLLWPLTGLGDTLDMYQRSKASTKRVFDLLNIQRKIKSGSMSLDKSKVEGNIELKNVTFEYISRTNRAIIHNLTLDIHAGETIGIVGPTGAGKTTLVKLLLRFYDVQSGEILIDGVDLREIKLLELRQAIGFVSQDIFLFHGTVKENITYGSFNAPHDEVVKAAKIAEADHFIQEFPDGYDTIVGERGQKLSGGQRQRISIARAVLKDPPILILDEATSSVDNETEALIQKSLEKITLDRTTIVIAHRLSTIRNADRIFVLETGELIEQGKHEQLVASGGVYASLWDVQTGEIFG